METQQEMLLALSSAVVNMEDETIGVLAKNYVEMGYAPLAGIMEGLVPGMQKAGELLAQGEYFIPEILVCSQAMYNGLDVLRPFLQEEKRQVKGKIVIGVVEGDTHDIGKNLVRLMLEVAGYELYDLGKDVPLERFVEKAQEVQADIIAMSALMSTTMLGMETVVRQLKMVGLRQYIKVIVGGAPVSAAFAKKIEADGYSHNALEAVGLVETLMARSDRALLL